jgi:hypothetical protein
VVAQTWSGEHLEDTVMEFEDTVEVCFEDSPNVWRVSEKPAVLFDTIENVTNFLIRPEKQFKILNLGRCYLVRQVRFVVFFPLPAFLLGRSILTRSASLMGP